MIITRTPFRISFAGGGSDLPSFYQKHEGCVLSTCINKYMYITIHPAFNKHETTIKYSKVETVNSIREIKHPIAKCILLDHKLEGVEIASVADIPAGTGLASSSAYTVGLAHAVNAYKGKYVSQERLAEYACEVELEKLGEPVGKQDQYGVSVGGMKFMRFFADGSVDITPIVISAEKKKALQKNLLMFYMGNTRSASDILKEQNHNMQDQARFNNLVRMTELCYELKEQLEGGDLSGVGDILHREWLLKRELADSISNPKIDRYYELALENGALGGKLLGAGGSGFLLLYCEKEKQKRLRTALSSLKELSFSFDNSGTKVIYVGNKDWE